MTKNLSKSGLMINMELGVGFAEYVQTYISGKVKSDYGQDHHFPLISGGDFFLNESEQNAVFNLPTKIKAVEFLKSNGDRYLINFHLSEKSKYAKLLDEIFLKHMFWAIEARHDIAEVNIDDSRMERMVLHFWIGPENKEEDFYITISRLIA